MRLHFLLPFAVIALVSARLYAAPPQSAQQPTPQQIYAQIRQASPIHWCLTQAGNDPGNVIGSACAVYSECLGALNLQDDVDRPPFAGLSEVQVNWVRRCHQVLDSAARSNAQIKGAAATEDWLEHKVYPGTEAKAEAGAKTGP